MRGIAEAKEAGVYRGRKPTIDVAEVRRLRDEGLVGQQIAQLLGLARTSIRRLRTLRCNRQLRNASSRLPDEYGKVTGRFRSLSCRRRHSLQRHADRASLATRL